MSPQTDKRPHVVIQLRGTNGSGKSTTVFNLLRSQPNTPILEEGSGAINPKIRGYKIKATLANQLPNDLYVVGPYRTACGGCDAVKTQDIACGIIREFAEKGDVLCEGLLASGLFSRYNSLADSVDAHFIFGFLDTPLELCIERTLQRREKAAASQGKEPKPFDPYKTLAPKYQAILSSRRKFEASGSDHCECCKKLDHCEHTPKDVRDVDHNDPTTVVLTWLKSDRIR